MARTKGSGNSKAKVKILVEDTVPLDSDFLIKLCDLLIVISPDYEGFPTQTLKAKLLKGDYNLTKHEKNFLMHSLDAVDKLATGLRLYSIDNVMLDVCRKISEAEEFEFQVKDAKDSLSTMD